MISEKWRPFIDMLVLFPPINIMKNGKETWSKIEHILNFHDCWGMTVEPIQKFAENSAHLPFHMRAWAGMGCWTLPCDFKKKRILREIRIIYIQN